MSEFYATEDDAVSCIINGGDNCPQYKYQEDLALRDIAAYINKTYEQHYAQNSIQTTEFVIDAGHGVGFTVGNIMKYAQRYGKKNGYNRNDIMKIIHYAIMLLYVHDTEMEGIDE
jgi:membrane-anchored protein YejM (alkaline phosphatase superfamily)